MPEREPVETTSLDDAGGSPPFDWSRVRDQFASLAVTWTPEHSFSFFLSTVRPDGRPHSAPFGAIWYDGDLVIVTGPGTRKGKNLAANPSATVSVALEGIDVVLEGVADRVTDPQQLESIAAAYRETGWPAVVEGEGFNAPFMAAGAGPAPWFVWRFRYDTVFGVATLEPHGATRWRFA